VRLEKDNKKEVMINWEEGEDQKDRKGAITGSSRLGRNGNRI